MIFYERVRASASAYGGALYRLCLPFIVHRGWDQKKKNSTLEFGDFNRVLLTFIHITPDSSYVLQLVFVRPSYSPAFETDGKDGSV
jgi:hypothetical protein